MQLNVKMNLNSIISLEMIFEGKDLKEAVKNATAFLDFDGKCGMCYDEATGKGKNLTLKTRGTKDGGFQYTEFICLDCGARRQLGTFKDGGGYFLKEWEPRWEGNKNEQ